MVSLAYQKAVTCDAVKQKKSAETAVFQVDYSGGFIKFTTNRLIIAKKFLLKRDYETAAAVLVNKKTGKGVYDLRDLYPIFYFQIFISDKIDMVILAVLFPVALLSAPMLAAKKYVLSAVSI